MFLPNLVLPILVMLLVPAISEVSKSDPASKLLSR